MVVEALPPSLPHRLSGSLGVAVSQQGPLRLSGAPKGFFGVLWRGMEPSPRRSARQGYWMSRTLLCHLPGSISVVTQ